MTAEARHCPPTHVLVAAAAPDADRAERERVADHVAACARCAEELRVVQALRGWSEQNAPLVSGDAPGHPTGRDAARSRVPHPAWAYAAAAVFAIAAAALGLQTVRLQQANRSLAERVHAAVDSARAMSQPPVDLQARVADQQHAIADLEQRLAASAAPDLNAPVVDLEPAERTRTAAPTPAAPDALPSDARTVVFILNTTHPNRGATYDVDLVAPDNRVMWSGSGLRQSADRTLTLVVPRSLLGAGTHLRLFSQNGPQRTLVEDYPIPVARR